MCSRPFRPLGFAHLCRSRPRGSIHSLLPSQLYLLCLPRRSLGEGGLLTPSAPFPSTSNCRVVHPIRSIVSRSLPLGSTATLAALPAMSLAPVAPLKLARCPHSLAAPLAVLPSMSLLPFAPLRNSKFRADENRFYAAAARVVKVADSRFA